MINAGIPRDVRDFLSKYIASIEQLEILLFIYKNTARNWQLDDIAQSLGIQTETTEKCLEGLCGHGLIQPHPFDEGYQARGTAELQRRVMNVSRTYSERRITIINFIFSRHLDRIRAFADSFKLKKDE